MNVPMNRSLMILIMACVSFENCDKLQMILVCYLLVLSKYSPGRATLVTLGHRRQFVGIIKCYDAAGCKNHSKKCSQLSASCVLTVETT